MISLPFHLLLDSWPCLVPASFGITAHPRTSYPLGCNCFHQPWHGMHRELVPLETLAWCAKSEILPTCHSQNSKNRNSTSTKGISVTKGVPYLWHIVWPSLMVFPILCIIVKFEFCLWFVVLAALLHCSVLEAPERSNLSPSQAFTLQQVLPPYPVLKPHHSKADNTGTFHSSAGLDQERQHFTLH